MQLTCANCAARYLVDPAAIGPAGRTVQCFRCGHKWRASLAPGATTRGAGVSTRDAPAIVPDVVIRPPDAAGITNLPVLAVERRTPIWVKAAAAVLVTVALVGGAGYLFGDRLVATLGVDEKTAAIRLVTGSNGQTALVIAGDIVNTGRAEAIAKRLRVVFKDAQGKPIAERDLELATGRIPPRGRARFEARIEDAPTASATIGIRAD